MRVPLDSRTVLGFPGSSLSLLHTKPTAQLPVSVLGLAKAVSKPSFSASSSLSSRATALFFWCCTGCWSPHVEHTILILHAPGQITESALFLRVPSTRFHSFSAHLLDSSARLRHSSVRRQPHLTTTAHNALSLATKRRPSAVSGDDSNIVSSLAAFPGNH